MLHLRKIAITALLLPALALPGAQRPRKRPAAGVRNHDQESVQAIAKLEDGMRLAALKGDSSWWADHLSEGYTGTDALGKVSDKKQTVALQGEKDLVYNTWNLGDRTVHIFNGDTILVTGKVTLEGSDRERNLGGDFQYIHVWVKNGLVWELAASQLTKVGAEQAKS